MPINYYKSRDTAESENVRPPEIDVAEARDVLLERREDGR
jgi:hypothetical protein